jgi:flagellum-specific peptidoglycan hydrolase FlgJ
MKKLLLILVLLPLMMKGQSKNNATPFSNKELIAYLLQKKIKHPHIVYAQAILETDRFTSRIFKENNNLFGMKYIHDCNCSITRNAVRETTALGSRYKHAYYSSWQSSVDDYLHWQRMFKRTPVKTEDEYFELLGKRYAVDKRYVSVLKKLITKDTIKWK